MPLRIIFIANWCGTRWVRLAKRHDALSIRHLRESGMTAEKVLEMTGWTR